MTSNNHSDVTVKELNYLDLFPDGLEIDKFKRIEEVSVYNHNYHSYKGKLIFAESDDDASTDYWLVRGKMPPEYLGYSDVRDNPEILCRRKEMPS